MRGVYISKVEGATWSTWWTLLQLPLRVGDAMIAGAGSINCQRCLGGQLVWPLCHIVTSVRVIIILLIILILINIVVVSLSRFRRGRWLHRAYGRCQ